MASPDSTELEKQLVEAGNRLLPLPPSVDEILSLLDQVENYLARVEQSPSKSMQTALSPSINALVADELLRHPDVDVKVAVASCISEITRITAPDAPYDDDRMKDIFQLIVSSFENLSDQSSRSYNKRTLILETVAKVRSCVVMLDLECDVLIVEMFQHFLKAIRDDHPDNVFSSMETIMTLVLEESEDISLELISPILASVKSDSQEVLPIARKLGERVLENCAIKLKPYLVQATKSLGLSLDDYSKVITSICHGTTGAAGHNEDNACREHLIDESKLARESSNGAVEADEDKLAVAAPDEAAQDQLTKGSVLEVRPEGDHPAEDRSPSVMSNGVAEAGYEDKLEDPESSKQQEQAHETEQSVDTNLARDGDDDSNSGKMLESDTKTEQTSKKRGRKPNSVIHSAEPPDSSQVDSGKEAETTADCEKDHSKEVRSSPSEKPFVEVDVPLENENINIQLSSLKASESEPMNVASPSSSGNVPGEGRPKRIGRSKKADNLPQEVATSVDVVSKKTNDGTSDLEGKPQRRSGKKAPSGRTTEEKAPALADKSENDGGTTSDSEAKPLKHCIRKLDATDNGDGSSLKKNEDGKRRRHGRGKASLKINLTKSSNRDDDKEIVPSPTPSSKLVKVEGHSEETPKTSSKRKRTPGKEKASDAVEYGDNLIDSKVKVWWPKDHMFYEGVIVSFDPAKKRHKVLYTDGDVEVLNLRMQRWELVEADSLSDAEQATECQSPDPSPEMHKKKKAKTSSEPSAKQRGKDASSSKSKQAATKSGPRSRVDRKLEDKSGDKSEDASGGKSEDRSQRRSGKSVGDGSKADGKLKDEGVALKTSTKSKLDTRKSDTKDTPKTTTKGTPKTASKSKGKSPKSGNRSQANGSGKVKSGASKLDESKGKEEEDETEAKEEELPETVKTPESAEGTSQGKSKRKKTGTKSASARKRKRSRG